MTVSNEICNAADGMAGCWTGGRRRVSLTPGEQLQILFLVPDLAVIALRLDLFGDIQRNPDGVTEPPPTNFLQFKPRFIHAEM